MRFLRQSVRSRRCRRAFVGVATVVGCLVATMIASTTPALALAHGSKVRTPLEAPWMATLAFKGDKPLPEHSSCGGALVAPTRVVTAAHCVAGMEDTVLQTYPNSQSLMEICRVGTEMNEELITEGQASGTLRPELTVRAMTRPDGAIGITRSNGWKATLNAFAIQFGDRININK